MKSTNWRMLVLGLLTSASLYIVYLVYRKPDQRELTASIPNKEVVNKVPEGANRKDAAVSDAGAGNALSRNDLPKKTPRELPRSKISGIALASRERQRLTKQFAHFANSIGLTAQKTTELINLLTTRSINQAQARESLEAQSPGEYNGRIQELNESFSKDLDRLLGSNVKAFREYEAKIPYINELSELSNFSSQFTEFDRATVDRLVAITKFNRESAGIPADFRPEIYPSASIENLDEYIARREIADNDSLKQIAKGFTKDQTAELKKYYTLQRDILRSRWDAYHHSGSLK